ncbi:hypothetical protein ARMGADRAFT_1004122 [Armillaria gallica]|uniref:Uncharacterized protein n=1 Tax=Armillaria gallica TaxID=47427 RepID=A0A2H3EAL7_ARMGA|nr:hypothetical protein ARMGADRAFT_1004122 [Armillaria gallica]
MRLCQTSPSRPYSDPFLGSALATLVWGPPNKLDLIMGLSLCLLSDRLIAVF